MVTAAEHHTLYQYRLANAANHYMGLIQTETVCVCHGIDCGQRKLIMRMCMQPYYQPVPAAPAPFSINSNFNDPTFPSGQTSAFAVSISNSQAITIFGTPPPPIHAVPQIHR